MKNSSSTSSMGLCFALLLSINLARVEHTQFLGAPHVVTTFHMPLGLQVGLPCPWLSATLSGPLLSAPPIPSTFCTFYPSHSLSVPTSLFQCPLFPRRHPPLGHSLELSFLQMGSRCAEILLLLVQGLGQLLTGHSNSIPDPSRC